MLRSVSRRLRQPSSSNHLGRLSSSTHLLNPPPCSTKRFPYYINNNNVFCCSSSYSKTIRKSYCSSVGSGDTNKKVIDLALGSVVKIFTVTNEPKYYKPWKIKSRQREYRCSGFVISGKRILTNAHVVVGHTSIRVKKHDSPEMYIAEVEAIGHECDLAILTVKNKEFWNGMNSLTFGDIPFLQDTVSVIGYPSGKDNISVMKGVFSYVKPTQYNDGGTTLLAIHINAPVSKRYKGYNGGPVVLGDLVVGVTFRYNFGSKMSYIIPVPIIKHFIAGVVESEKYAGFCSMDLMWQDTENSQLREHFRMHPDMTGVRIRKINPLSDVFKVLKIDDILLSFDGVRIANDGTVPFRNGEGIPFDDHLVPMKKPNETAFVKVLRDGEELEFSIKLRPVQPLVPIHQYDKLPSYFIFAGLVFIPLTKPYLDLSFNGILSEQALWKMPKTSGQQLVILSQVLLDDINAGYEELDQIQVMKVNGIAVENLKHLFELVENCDKESIRFDLDHTLVIILNYEKAKAATSRILEHYRIPSASYFETS